MQLDGYPQGAGNTRRGLADSAGSFPGEGSTELGASLRLLVAAVTEVAEKGIFFSIICILEMRKREK